MTSTQFNDLPDDCLLLVFDQLPPDQLFKFLLVNKKLNRLAASKLRSNVKVIRLVEPKDRPSTACKHLASNSANQVLVLEKLFKDTELPLYDAPTRACFFRVLAKCPGVRSIDFSYFDLPGNLLLKVVRRCPELECLMLSDWNVKEGEWNRILDQIGSRILHFVKITFNSGGADEEEDDVLDSDSEDVQMVFNSSRLPSEKRLLELIASKCPNIRQVDWMQNTMANDLIATIKTLPPNCWVRFVSNNLNEDVVFQDAVDELNTYRIHWSALGHRLKRLSSLKFFRLCDGFVTAVDFLGLKKLDVGPGLDVSSLGDCQFPRLEEFSFVANRSFTEDHYDRLFKPMPTVRMLTIVLGINRTRLNLHLPLSSIHRLKNLETIVLRILYAPENTWKPKHMFQQLEQYVNGDCNTKIRTLKKLTINIESYCCGGGWQKTVENEVARMKARQQIRVQKQSRVEIDLIFLN